MILCEFNSRMNSKEVSEFKRTWTDNIFGSNNQIKLSDNISIYKPRSRKIFGDTDSYYYPICVYGHNMIKLGEFKVDNGFLGENNYYPIIRFYNELNYTAIGGYDCGQPNNYSITSKTDKLTITTEKLLDVVRKSFEYIKIFE